MASRKRSGSDFIVVGGGVAALRAALQLAGAGHVTVLAKTDFLPRSTQGAENGAPVPSGEDEALGLHLQSTLRAGDGLCREQAARILVEEGPARIEELIEWAGRQGPNGAWLEFAVENARSACRVLRAGGESVSRQMLRTLAARARSMRSLTARSEVVPVDLVVEDGRVAGVSFWDAKAKAPGVLRSKAVLVATGGLGQVYPETTNPQQATGDGVALAFRAGALLSDMEFVHFHPTTLHSDCSPSFLLPESLRAEGGKLRNFHLERFMPRYHEAGELAPADVISRAIVTEMQRCQAPFVYLDLTRLNGALLKERFTRIYNACLECNLDITADLLPVRPAAHCAIGGVATSLEGATTLPGLYAAGEASATGLHGANCLPANAPLEELVFGARAAAAMLAGAPPLVAPAPPGRRAGSKRNAPADHGERASHRRRLTNLAPEALRARIRSLMWEKVGIIRRGQDLDEAVRLLDGVSGCRPHQPDGPFLEALNLLEVARLIARSALAREESRGAHYRDDFPLRDDSKAARHSYLSKDSGVYLA